MLEELYKKIKVFLKNSYTFEDMENLYHEFMNSEDTKIEDAKILDLFKALDSEQSYWS